MTSRKSLQKLVALVQEYQVAEVVVTFSDRFTRFGLSYLTVQVLAEAAEES